MEYFEFEVCVRDSFEDDISYLEIPAFKASSIAGALHSIDLSPVIYNLYLVLSV